MLAGIEAARELLCGLDERLDVDLVPLYFELDGSFPHHEANPLDPANLVDLQRAVVAHGADLGLAFDGDADRCFVVDERGEAVSPSAITGLVAARELARAHDRGESDPCVIYNLITSRAVPELVAEGDRLQLAELTGPFFAGTTSTFTLRLKNYGTAVEITRP